MKTVKVTLIVLGILAVVGIIARIGYMKIQDHNKKVELQNVLDVADNTYEVLLEQAETCKCFPENELTDWKTKMSALHTTDDDFSAYEFKHYVTVFKDSVFSKRMANGDFD